MRKVLVVDDEANMRFFLRMVFESDGYEVAEAHHGAAALERVADDPPELVVTDLMMPVMNGRELVARLREDRLTTGIPIVMLVSGPLNDVPEADAILRKPFEAVELLDAVRSLSRKDTTR